jgi:hypothetical protein
MLQPYLFCCWQIIASMRTLFNVLFYVYCKVKITLMISILYYKYITIFYMGTFYEGIQRFIKSFISTLNNHLNIHSISVPVWFFYLTIFLYFCSSLCEIWSPTIGTLQHWFTFHNEEPFIAIDQIPYTVIYIYIYLLLKAPL